MEWDRLDPGWQAALRAAWEAYLDDTVPIGAAILRPDGRIAATGRNRIFSTHAAAPQLSGSRLAHAEVNALLSLSEPDLSDIRRCTMYTTLEPCPLCFGAIVMGNIRHVKYAARDTLAGAAALNGRLEYIESKRILVEGPFSALEDIQIALCTCFELEKDAAKADRILARWEVHSSAGVAAGRALRDSGILRRLRNVGACVRDALSRIGEVLLSG